MREELKRPIKINLMILELEIFNLLQEYFPKARSIPRENLIPMIHDQIVRAYMYGLETEQQFKDYVFSAWQLGSEFNIEFPAVKEVMDSDLPSVAKSAWLTKWTGEMIHAFNKGE